MSLKSQMLPIFLDEKKKKTQVGFSDRVEHK
jgi:hypothetical protein